MSRPPLARFEKSLEKQQRRLKVEGSFGLCTSAILRSPKMLKMVDKFFDLKRSIILDDYNLVTDPQPLHSIPVPAFTVEKKMDDYLMKTPLPAIRKIDTYYKENDRLPLKLIG